MLGEIQCNAGDFNADLSRIYDPRGKIVRPREDMELQTGTKPGDGAVGNSGTSRLEVNQDPTTGTLGWLDRVRGALNRIGGTHHPALPLPFGRGARGRLPLPP